MPWEVNMSRKIRKLTPAVLRKIVLEETSRVNESLSGELEDTEKVEAEVVAADELGTAAALAKDIDHAKVLKLEEAKLNKKIKRIQEMRRRLRARIVKGL